MMSGENFNEDFQRFSHLALKRVSVREYGSGELCQYLKRKGATQADAQKIVEDLKERGYIDDRRYARVIARHQAARDKGPQYVQGRLRQKGVNLGLPEIKKIYEDCLSGGQSLGKGESELEAIERVLERRYPNARTDRSEAKRAYQALLRRGYSADLVGKTLFSSKLPSESSSESSGDSESTS